MNAFHNISLAIIFVTALCFLCLIPFWRISDVSKNSGSSYSSQVDEIIYRHPYRNPLNHQGTSLPAGTTVYLIKHKSNGHIDYAEILHYDGTNYTRGYVIEDGKGRTTGLSPKWKNLKQQKINQNTRLYDDLTAQFMKQTEPFVKSGSGAIEKNKVFPFHKKAGHKKGFDASYYETADKFYYTSWPAYVKYIHYLNKAKRTYKKNYVRYLYCQRR